MKATALAAGAFFALGPISIASGILMDGASARSQALGGASTAGTGLALDALAANPAALGLNSRVRLEVGGGYGWLDGEFRSRANDGADVRESGGLPNGAIAGRVGPLTLGVGVVSDAVLRAAWTYRDAPGGLTGLTSYGEREHLSEIGLLRIAFGASYELTRELSIGACLGLLYNRNTLRAPYTIQTQPQLAGAKTLLDLETDGWGLNAQFGVLWKPIDSVRVGLAYTLPSRLRTNGHATSDATRQLRDLGLTDVDGRADFDAEVTNQFPQIVSGSVAWRAVPRLELVAQVDWINWADAFDTLEVRLRKVDNPLYRTLLADKRNLDDDVPLDWRDQWAFRVGAEYQVAGPVTARVGYRYARNPVPGDTLTPLTAAIPEHIISAGLGVKQGPFTADLAYQFHPPTTARVDRSRLRNGEYDGSEVEVSLHWVALTLGVEF